MARTLERSITMKDLALLVVGAVIGSGIFIVPATVLAQVDGDVGTALVVWLIGGVLSLLGALTYGELGAARPHAGGLYVFMRDAFGPFVAFLFGWTLFFAIGAGAVATLANAFVGYLGQFVTLSTFGGKVVGIVMIAVIAGLNVRGTRMSTSATVWATVVKFSALLGLSLALLFSARADVSANLSLLPQNISFSALSAAGIAMIGVLWAFEGWQYVTFAAGETVDPRRTFPRGIAIGTAALVLLYLLANLAYIGAIGPTAAMASDSIAATAVEARFGPLAARLVTLPILISIASAANAVVLTTSRVFYAMARDRLFFRRLGELHASFGTPAFSIVAFAAWGAVLAASGTFQQLLTYTVFAGWIFYALGAAAIFVFRRTEPAAPRPFRVPGYPVTPVLFVAAASAIVLNTLVTQPAQAIVGILVVLAGAPAFLIWTRGRSIAAAGVAREGEEAERIAR